MLRTKRDDNLLKHKVLQKNFTTKHFLKNAIDKLYEVIVMIISTLSKLHRIFLVYTALLLFFMDFS